MKRRKKRRGGGVTTFLTAVVAVLALSLGFSALYVMTDGFAGTALGDLIADLSYGGDNTLWLEDEEGYLLVSAAAGADEEDDRFVIALDAGHGGADCGAANAALGLYEDKLNLAIAEELCGCLEETGRFRVVMIRGKLARTAKLAISDRLGYAAAEGADLYLSLHNNTSEPQYSGAEIYYSGTGSASAESAERLAGLMLREMGELGMRRRGIFVRMSQTAEKPAVAGTVAETNGETGGAAVSGADISGTTGGDPVELPTGAVSGLADYYAVIRGGEQLGIPSLLVEHGFINKNDADFISGKQAAKALAEAHTRAILEWCGFERYDHADSVAAVQSDVGPEDAMDVLMCEKDSDVGARYRAMDADGDGVLEAGDVAKLMRRETGAALAPQQMPSERVDKRGYCTIEADTEQFRKGGTVNVTVTLTSSGVPSAGGIYAACGTIDYNTKYFELIKSGKHAPSKGFRTKEDRIFGLVRYAYKAEKVERSDFIEMHFSFRMKGEPEEIESLTMNANCWSMASGEPNGTIEEFGQTTASWRFGVK